MKKMLFSAIAMIAFAGSAFANNVEDGETTKTVIEYKYEIVTSKGGPLLDVTDVKCYYRVCITSSKEVTSCTDWLEKDCSKTADTVGIKVEEISSEIKP